MFITKEKRHGNGHRHVLEFEKSRDIYYLLL